MQSSSSTPSNRYAHMKKLFTPIFLILLFIVGAGQASGQNPIKYPGKLDIKFIDFRSLDFMSLYNPVDTFNKVPKIWKLQLNVNKDAENQEFNGTKPILNLGSIPEALLKHQSDTLLQWGHTLGDLILILRIGVRIEDFEHIDIQNKPDNTYILNFIIDFWFK